MRWREEISPEQQHRQKQSSPWSPGLSQCWRPARTQLRAPLWFLHVEHTPLSSPFRFKTEFLFLAARPPVQEGDAATALSRCCQILPRSTSAKPSTSHEQLLLTPGPTAGAVGGCRPCPTHPRPAYQARGVNAGGYGDRRHPGLQASQGPHHPRPHLPRRWELRGHWHVRGVWPGGQGNGGAWGHRFLHHRCCCLHLVR